MSARRHAWRRYGSAPRNRYGGAGVLPPQLREELVGASRVSEFLQDGAHHAFARRRG